MSAGSGTGSPADDGLVLVPRQDLMQVLNAIAWNPAPATALSASARAAVDRLRDIARDAPDSAS